MFYSHEVLTSRKYGVATIWLVATLGSKSTVKKVSRKAILDVNVAKACETIVASEAPMALRLQSSLLSGITRVYNSQCEYVLNDVEHVHGRLRAMYNAVHASDTALQADTARGRAGRLVLEDDPDFIPDLDVNPADLLDFQKNPIHESQLSAISAHSSQLAGHHSSLQSLRADSGSSLGEGYFGSIDVFGNRDIPNIGRRSEPVALLNDDTGFTIEADGTIHIDDAPTPKRLDVAQRIVQSSDGFVSAGRFSTDQFARNVLPTAQDDLGLPSDDGFTESKLGPDAIVGSSNTQYFPTNESAQASARRNRRPPLPLIPLDGTTELRNRDISDWNQNYLHRMRAASQLKKTSRLAALAKKNANLWTLRPRLVIGCQAPLEIFRGAKIIETFTGINLLRPITQKRCREDDEESDVIRCVRSRSEAPSLEVGRLFANDDKIALSSNDNTIEIGREAPTPLNDRRQSSMLPWNLSASSRRRTDQHLTSASIGPLMASINRQGSRLVSASPLLGRESESGPSLDDFRMRDLDIQMSGLDDFELFGLAAQVDTQTANQSQWQRATLIEESTNFREFVHDAINRAHLTAVTGQEDSASLQDGVAFDILLPPQQNSRVVAAQALLHVLTLSTCGVLKAVQVEAFGPINLCLSGTVWRH